MGTMLNAGHDLPLRRTVGLELAGDHLARRTALSFQELSHQTLGSLGIAAALNQDVKVETILIDGAPEPMFLAGDRDHHLVEVPFVTEPAS